MATIGGIAAAALVVHQMFESMDRHGLGLERGSQAMFPLSSHHIELYQVLRTTRFESCFWGHPLFDRSAIIQGTCESPSRSGCRDACRFNCRMDINQSYATACIRRSVGHPDDACWREKCKQSPERHQDFPATFHERGDDSSHLQISPPLAAVGGNVVSSQRV